MNMGETIKIGGVGKSPVIEKLNKLNAISAKQFAVEKLCQSIFNNKGSTKQEGVVNQEKIIEKFGLDFTKN